MTNLIEGPFDAERVRGLREVLTASGAGIYLATHLAGPLAAESMAAARESDDMELRVGRATPDHAEDLLQRDREARAVLAAALHGSPDRMALAHGAADGARLVALEALREWPSGRGRAIVAVGDHDRAVIAALESVATATGAPFMTAGSDVEAIGDAALVAIAQVASDGTLADLGRLAAVARAAGARTLLDASLAVGATPLELPALEMDALVADAHRWLLGPEATSVIWLGPAFGDGAPAAIRAATSPFGRGTLIELARSVGWLLMYAELPWVLGRTRLVTERLLERLAAVDGVELLTDRGAHAALIAFRIEGWTAEQAADELSRSVFAILEADLDGDRLRIGPGAWNREQELDRFVDRVAELAAHSPDSLPRRPMLTVLASPSVADP